MGVLAGVTHGIHRKTGELDNFLIFERCTTGENGSHGFFSNSVNASALIALRCVAFLTKTCFSVSATLAAGISAASPPVEESPSCPATGSTTLSEMVERTCNVVGGKVWFGSESSSMAEKASS